ncbi:DUF2785 domain-containing protein [Clostridium sulfidigenes]|uniref:DUF2785 domain-containing protein n=1 Tax=Clostridium sulfidigenes TaxID=318464 RepID=UPI003F8A3620
MTQKENILKEKLLRVKKNKYLLENQENYFSLGLEMMDNIGCLDPELRDRLIYVTFFHWITEGRFNFEQLEHLLSISLDNTHLFYRIYDKDEDAVFARAFSVLIVALIIDQHRKQDFLLEEKLYKIKDKLLEYMHLEQDVRGYVHVRGWAHSAAHTADALDELVQCNCFNKVDLLDILNSIKSKMCIGYYVYVDDESERMVTAVKNALDRKILTKSEIIEWLQGFSVEDSKSTHINYYHLKVNIKGFLRSLYFRLLEQDDFRFIIEEIRKLLKKL